MVWRERKSAWNEKEEGSTVVKILHGVCPRHMSGCVRIFEFSVVRNSFVTYMYICKRISSYVFINIYIYFPISEMSTQEMCFETRVPVNNRWLYFLTTQLVPRIYNIVSTRYVCFVCLYYVLHRLSVSILHLDFQFLPLIWTLYHIRRHWM